MKLDQGIKRKPIISRYFSCNLLSAISEYELCPLSRCLIGFTCYSKWVKNLFLIFAFLLSCSAFAEVEHQLLRRIAVFPIADANVASAEDSWWQMREILTKDPKFLVASRRFMINRGVFQPRRALKPADAVILGKILDAQAIIVTYLDDRTLNLKVYDGENGYLLWDGQLVFHPALPINDQLVRVSTKLVQDFVVAIPYQGFQVVDPATNKATYDVHGKTMAQVFMGNNTTIQINDPVQWVKVTGDISKPFFSDGMKVSVVAEGVIRSIKKDVAEIEVQKMTDPKNLKENALVRFPREIQRLKDLYSNDDKSASLSNEYLSNEMKSSQDFKKEHSSTSTALGFIAGIAAYVLIAF
jgi:hypothetical protein